MSHKLLKSPLPLPEIYDERNLSHSFKQPNRKPEILSAKRPPKLYPKHEYSFNRSFNSPGAHLISFRNNADNYYNKDNGIKKIGREMPVNRYYDRCRTQTYFEQCFDIIEKIGEGSFGEVFKVQSKEDGCFYAVKKSKLFFRSEVYRNERIEEVKSYEKFSDDEHCVTLYRAWEENDRLYMQMELCKSNLQTFAMEMKWIPEAMVWSILLDLLLALKGMHDCNLIHLDIKLENILITDDGVCKLADFGLVYDLNRRDLFEVTEGDSRYVAPELLQGKINTAVDIFSLGIAILELSSNLILPSNGPLWQELRLGILPDDEIIKFISNELLSVIKWMMLPDPKQRPTVDVLLQHPRIFTEYKKRNKWKFIRKMKTIGRSMYIRVCTLRNTLIAILNIIKNWLSLTSSIPPSLDGSSLLYDDISDIEKEDTDELQITPKLNNSIPRNLPSVNIINSTPLNHNMNNRKFRRGFNHSKLMDEAGDLNSSTRISHEDSFDQTPNSSWGESSSMTCKKLFSQMDDSE